MKTTGIANLKARLSSYLKLVKTGEEILITERNVAIAKIVPVEALGPDLEALRDLERKGLLKIGSGRLPRNFWKMPRGKDPKASVRSAAREERERGW